jgi:hypothetical protein
MSLFDPNISDVISWKFNDQPGMRCKEIAGVMTIIEFPGGIPSQADQDLWMTEFITWRDAGGWKAALADFETQTSRTVKIAFKVLIDEINILRNEINLINSNTNLSPRTVLQFKQAIENKVNGD